MKKLFTLTMVISLAMICSCQKQDSAAERQLAQRKAELDAREKELDEREKALAERENAKVQSVPDARPRRQVRDPAQVKAERDSRLQQLPPDAHSLIGVPSGGKGEDEERAKRREERTARKLEEVRRAKNDAAQMQTRNKEAKSAAQQSAAEQLERMRINAAEMQKKGAISAGAAYPASQAASPPPLAVYPQPEATSPPSLEASPGTEATSPSPSPTPQ